jgi:uncharacterized membrane protein YhaH (DUF805 family)
MTFAQAISSVLRQYATFTGRARRSELWWFVLFTALVSAAMQVLDNALFGSLGSDVAGGPLRTLVGIALLVPTLAVGARRLHDTDRSGWWQLIALAPVAGIIVLAVLWVVDSSPGANRFGASAT